MPIYEFLCHSCRHKFGVLVRQPSATSPIECPSCGAADIERLMSTFAYHRSVNTIYEESGEPTLLPKADFYQDPRNIGRWTEKRFSELGLEVPNKIKKDIQIAREGEPLKIEVDS
jgi:putative FmdB family regulatory protein